MGFPGVISPRNKFSVLIDPLNPWLGIIYNRPMGIHHGLWNFIHGLPQNILKNSLTLNLQNHPNI